MKGSSQRMEHPKGAARFIRRGALGYRVSAACQTLWQEGGWGSGMLAPLGWAYGGGMALRRSLYRRRGGLRPRSVPIPVVVVGNLTVGGTGKTPLVLAVCEALQRMGRRPAVISRGYGRTGREVHIVSKGQGLLAPVGACGDEPALLAQRLPIPIVVAADRVMAARRAGELGADCAVADDGFQHLPLRRDLALVVVDGKQGFGNGRCLPAGPLREPRAALDEADAVVVRGTMEVNGIEPDFQMELVPEELRGIQERDQRRDLKWLHRRRVHAVAGIAYPERFFADLQKLGALAEPSPFPDHHVYHPAEVTGLGSSPLVTTEKDAIKLAEMGVAGWFLRIRACLRPDLEFLLQQLPSASALGVS